MLSMGGEFICKWSRVEVEGMRDHTDRCGEMFHAIKYLCKNTHDKKCRFVDSSHMPSKNRRLTVNESQWPGAVFVEGY